MGKKVTNENENVIVPYDNLFYAKSNALISSMYSATLLENKLMAISLSKLTESTSEGEGVIYSRMKASELAKLMNKKNGSFYDQLKNTAQNMTGKVIGVNNEEKHTFDYIAVIIRSYYKDGVFTIEYNPHMRDYLLNLKKNFTQLEYSEMLSFKSNYSFRLYELLKSEAYAPKGAVGAHKKRFKISYSVSEFKLLIGIVNSNYDSVRRILNNKTNPDYDKAVEASPEKNFERWNDLKYWVIDKAVKEIEEKTSMRISYETQKAGKGGKVYQIDFIVSFVDAKVGEEEQNSEDIVTVAELTPEQREKFLEDMDEILSETLKLKDMKAIAQAAGYDMKRFKKAYRILKESTKPVKNMVGFLISALENDYSEPTESKGKNYAFEFNTFMQQDYDYDALEEELLAN